jgi:site-specific recombinase XerD
MPAMRDFSSEEITLLRKSFGGRYALRDRCYFEMGLQLGLRVSEMLSLTVGQVYQYGNVLDEVSIERRYMKGGKAGKASGRTLPIFSETKPHILAWLQRMAELLGVKSPQQLDPTTPLFISRVHHKDGTPRAVCRETMWKILTTLVRENSLPGHTGTHCLRKTLARQAQVQFHGDVRKVQKILGHKSLSSTEHYLRSLTDQEVWQEFHRHVA